MPAELETVPRFEEVVVDPDLLVSGVIFEASYSDLETVEDANRLINGYLLGLRDLVDDKQTAVVPELAKAKLKAWLLHNAPLGQPTAKEHHPSRRRFRSRNLLVMGMEEILGPEHLDMGAVSTEHGTLTPENRFYRVIVRDLIKQGHIDRSSSGLTTVA